MEPTRIDSVEIFGLGDGMDPDGWPVYRVPKYKHSVPIDCTTKPPDLEQRIEKLRKKYEQEIIHKELGGEEGG